MSETEVQGVPYKKVLLVGLASAVLLAGLGAGAAMLWPRYRSWSAGRALQEAQEAQLAGEYRRQQLFLEQALQVDPGNREARRRLADFYDLGGQPQASEIWRLLAEEQPELLENHQGLVLSLVRRGEAEKATAALGRVPESLRDTAEYHRLAAAVATLAGDATALEAHLEVLSRRGAAAEGLRVSRASLALSGARPEQREAAERELVELARQDKTRIRATLALLRAAALDPVAGQQAVFSLAERILPPPKTRLFPAPKPGLMELLQHMMGQPSPVADDAVELMRWMRQRGLGREALQWCAMLSPEVRGAQPVQAQRAECAMQLGQWRELRAAVGQGAWGPVPEEVLVLVFASRIQRDAGAQANSRATWADAQALAERNPAALRVLARLADGWGWRPESERCLGLLVRLFPAEQALWGSLLHLAQQSGSSERTLQVLADWSRAQSAPARVGAELRLLSALLGKPVPPAGTPAAAPQSADPQSALAAALEAARSGAPFVVPELPADAGLSPRARLALAVLLAQAGRREEARVLAEGLAQVAFLPEEKELLGRVGRGGPLF